MRTPKQLYAEERIMYRPELLTCLHCGDLLVTWNYLAWDKIVQTLDRLLSIATDRAAALIRRVRARACVYRILSTRRTLRSRWLAQLEQPTFEEFLAPLKHLEWPILAVLTDKQTGLVPAVATVWPDSQHQFCQAHYLRHLAEPLATADAVFKRELRQTVREQVGDVLRQEPGRYLGQGGVLTVTGLVPSPVEELTASAGQLPAPAAAPMTSSPEAEPVITQLVRHTHYVLTLKAGRP